MASDYKQNAINSALIEMYCNEDKYGRKNVELKEKSQQKN